MGRAEEAEGVLWRMEERGCKWDSVTWTTVISAYAKARPAQPEQAERLLVCMAERRVPVDTISYSGVIAAYINTSPPQIEKAENILDIMTERRVKANSFAFSSIIMAYLNSKPCRLEDAERVLTRMQQHGIYPDRVMQKTLDKAHAEQRGDPPPRDRNSRHQYTHHLNEYQPRQRPRVQQMTSL